MKRKISETDLDATTRYELETRLNGMPNHTKVCHGDFNPSNIIIDESGTPYVIDWSHATQGNGSADAARTYLLFRLNHQEELAEKSGQTSDEVTFSDDALAELRRAVLVEELDGLIFLNPDRYNENNPDIGWETADEYLSGNVRDKLRVAKAMAADTDNPQAERFAGNVAALEKVQPEWIEASDIDVKIGTTWIEPLDYEQFIYELLNTPRRARAVRSQFYNTGIRVHLNKMSMEWFIENKSMDKHSVAATKTYGTSRMDAYSIFEDTLNLKTVTVRDLSLIPI